jgi:cytosol alanyl aminopeptidase
MRSFVLRCAVLFGWVTLSSLSMADIPLGRLPENVRPTHYAIELDLDPNQEGFTGSVQIKLMLDQEQDHIWLHGKDLSVRNVQASTLDGDVLGSYAQLDDSGVAKLSFPALLPKGELLLRMQFSGRYSLRLDGLYKVMDGGLPYLFTQFESVFARQMFPGFDEPGFKTPFDMKLTIPTAMRAIFNTPEIAREVQGLRQTVRYQTTQKLPTYLLAVVVGEIDIVDHAPIPATAVRATPIPFRGIATKGKGKLMGYALENTAPIVEKLEAYFDTPYPYEKLDIIAVPDFASGAMENAGAITYREQLLLMQSDAPIAQKVAYTGTHAHELAHQWFGNLVTPIWWDDIWLNEAFATWMGLKIGERVQPNFNFQNRIQNGAMAAMDLDSFASARKIRNEVNNKNEIMGAFDAITYRKGGGVLAMFEAYLGEEKFRAGVRLHMQRHAHGNAGAKDFLRALSDAANDPAVVPAFESFLTQNGVPSIAMQLQCKGKSASLQLTQSRYLNVGQAAPAQRWQVPLCVRFERAGKAAQQCLVLSKPVQSMQLDTKACPKWVMPNQNGRAYARLQLADEDWQRLLTHQAQLTSAELLTLHDALLAGLYAGHIAPSLYLQRAEKLAGNMAPDVLANIATGTRFVFDSLLADDPKSAKQARALFAKTWPKIGIAVNRLDQAAPAAWADARLRVLEFVANTGRDARLRALLAQRGARVLGLDGKAPDASAIQLDLRELALSVVLQERGDAAVPVLLPRMLASTDAVFRMQALRALGTVRQPAWSAQLREFTLDKGLRGNEVMVILSAQANRRATRTALWAWAKVHMSDLLARLSDKSAVQVFELASSQCDANSASEIDAYFQPQLSRISNGPRGLANALEKIKRCVALRASNR